MRKRAGRNALATTEFSEETATKILQEHIFSNPLITDCILENLCTWDLLDTSLVCKSWNTVSRDFLQRRRQCLFNCNLENADELEDRQTLLENGILNHNHPFTGIYIVMGNLRTGIFEFRCADIEGNTFRNPPGNPTDLSRYWENRSRVGTSLASIISSIPIKHVTIAFKEDKLQFFPGHYWSLKFLFGLLPMDAIGSLRFKGASNIPYEELLQDVPDSSYSNLKKIQTDYLSYWERHLSPQDYNAILRVCPALTEFDMAVEFSSVKIFEKYNKLPLIKYLHLHRSGRENDAEGENPALADPEVLTSVEVLSIGRFSQYDCISQIIQANVNSLRQVILFETQHPAHQLAIYMLPLPSIDKVVVKEPQYMYTYFDNPSKYTRFFPSAEIKFIKYLYINEESDDSDSTEEVEEGSYYDDYHDEDYGDEDFYDDYNDEDYQGNY